MPIPVVREPDPQLPYERCVFCRERTIYWTDIPERTTGAQVACCPGCGCCRQPAEVPTKAEWLAKERAINPEQPRVEPPSPWVFQGIPFPHKG